MMDKEINDIMAQYKDVSDIADPRMTLNDMFWLFSHIRKVDEELDTVRIERDALKEDNKRMRECLCRMCVNQQNIGRCKYNKAECEKCGCPAALGEAK